MVPKIDHNLKKSSEGAEASHFCEHPESIAPAGQNIGSGVEKSTKIEKNRLEIDEKSARSAGRQKREIFIDLGAILVSKLLKKSDKKRDRFSSE